MKLAHLADLHLGYRQFDRQNARGANQREADVAEAFRRAVDDLLEQRPDLILFAGDIFHSVRPTNPAILFLFQQLQRLRVALPDTPVVLVAGDHDTPRTSETGSILKLYEAVGAEVVIDAPRRLVYPKLDCAVLAVPHQALVSPERPALRPERGGPTFNVLVTHGQYPALGEARGTMDYGGAPLSLEDLSPATWDYVALGHYHVAQELAANVWYSGSLEYLPPNPWGQLQDQAERGLKAKCYLQVSLPKLRVAPRYITPVRQHLELEPIQGAGLAAKQLDAKIAAAVAQAKPAIDGNVVRLLVWDVARATAHDLDHPAIRSYKARALHFQLDLRRPQSHYQTGIGAPSRRQTLPETLRDFLSRRLLDADIPRDDFVRTGVEYLEQTVPDG
ncbi:MAG TPA: DNA repair exonuclease, partial [Gemmatimonadales bacterium]|nr:DNA repair exonuclease [Gemmatimonadales bacterium]